MRGTVHVALSSVALSRQIVREPVYRVPLKRGFLFVRRFNKMHYRHNSHPSVASEQISKKAAIFVDNVDGVKRVGTSGGTQIAFSTHMPGNNNSSGSSSSSKIKIRALRSIS